MSNMLGSTSLLVHFPVRTDDIVFHLRPVVVVYLHRVVITVEENSKSYHRIDASRHLVVPLEMQSLVWGDVEVLVLSRLEVDSGSCISIRRVADGNSFDASRMEDLLDTHYPIFYTKIFLSDLILILALF